MNSDFRYCAGRISPMWLYCPKCSAQKNAGNRSLYNVFTCGTCSHRFRGIHAKPNMLWHTMRMLLTPSAESLTDTCCVHCGGTICGSDTGWWPSVCKHCGRDLPKDRPAQKMADVSQHFGETAKREVRPVDPPPLRDDDFDGCGACTSCGFIFQMMFNNAVCPRCGNKMSREDAFFSCGSYPDSVPPENQ